MPIQEGLTDVVSLLPFRSVDQLGQNGAALPADVRQQLDSRCGLLAARMDDRNNKLQQLQSALARAAADEIYRRIDPQLPGIQKPDKTVRTALQQLQSNPDSYLETPAWQRSLVRAGLAPELARSQVIRIPTDRSSNRPSAAAVRLV
jgi:hypothetical protein